MDNSVGATEETAVGEVDPIHLGSRQREL
jgi:hypothetical protein